MTEAGAGKKKQQKNTHTLLMCAVNKKQQQKKPDESKMLQCCRVNNSAGDLTFCALNMVKAITLKRQRNNTQSLIKAVHQCKEQ